MLKLKAGQTNLLLFGCLRICFLDAYLYGRKAMKKCESVKRNPDLL